MLRSETLLHDKECACVCVCVKDCVKRGTHSSSSNVDTAALCSVLNLNCVLYFHVCLMIIFPTTRNLYIILLQTVTYLS